MKIAVLASSAGEKAVYLHDFFKEGNRITVDSLVTDNPEAEIVERMRAEGIDVFYVLPGQENTGIAQLLKDRDVELLVVDDFRGEIPSELKEAFGRAIVYPTGVTSAPLEVIQATKPAPIESVLPAGRRESAEAEPKTKAEEEWAEVLKEEVEVVEALEQEENPQASEGESHPEEGSVPPAIPAEEIPSSHHVEPPRVPGTSRFGAEPPRVPESREHEPMPDTYLVWSVIITILCCFIPGVIAIVYSAQVSSRYYAGDIEGARRSSRNAQVWCIVSIIAGIVWATLYLPLTLFIG